MKTSSKQTKEYISLIYDDKSFIKDIATIVEKLRTKKNVSQSKLAKAIKTSQPNIWRLESGKDYRTPSLNLLYRIGNELNYDLEISFKKRKTNEKI